MRLACGSRYRPPLETTRIGNGRAFNAKLHATKRKYGGRGVISAINRNIYDGGVAKRWRGARYIVAPVVVGLATGGLLSFRPTVRRLHVELIEREGASNSS